MNVNYKVGDRFILEIAGGDGKYGFSFKDGNGDEIPGLLVSEEVLRRLPQDMTYTEEYRPYRSWYVLLSASEDDLTSDERARLVRIRSIPNTVKNLIMKRCEELQKSIVLLESEHDTLMDYINGERGAE